MRSGESLNADLGQPLGQFGGKVKNVQDLWGGEILAPQVGLEPTTLRLTAECSAIELLRSVVP